MATCADKINPELHKSETVHTKQVQKEIITPKCVHHSSLADDKRLSGDDALTKKNIDTLRNTTIYHTWLKFQENLAQS